MTTCIYCCATVHRDWLEEHYRWHAQLSLHGVDCLRAVQSNAADQVTECTCGLLP